MPDINVPKLEQQAKDQGYLRRDEDELDEAFNVVADGALDDTISSRMQRWKIGGVPHPNKVKKVVGRFMCWWLGLIQKQHDVKANVGDLERAKLEEQRTEKTLEDSGVNPDA